MAMKSAVSMLFLTMATVCSLKLVSVISIKFKIKQLTDRGFGVLGFWGFGSMDNGRRDKQRSRE